MKKYILGIFLTGVRMLYAQDNSAALQQLMKQDSVDINTLAAYPEKVRQNMFEVSSHPEGVAKLNDIQKKSNEDFKNLLTSFSKDEQQKIWNLTRYDGLIGKVAGGGKKSREEIEVILKNYPKDIHDDAVYYADNNFDLITGIDQQNKQFNNSFTEVVKPYSEKTQAAFRELINTPEVITLLNNNMNMTVRLGDIYKSDPQLVKKSFDELNLQLAQQKAKDLEDWKQTVQNDPEAKNELKQATDQYAKENGYKETDYVNTEPVVVEHYVYVPYPYWCGYPRWYSDPYWYPYPYWYHFGFYYWHNDFVWISPPSWYFIHWHFHHHPNIYHYPHLTNTYLHYYYGPRRSVSSNTREVNQWVTNKRKNLPEHFFKNDAQRVDRIKEIGKFEMNYDEQIKRTPVKREEFLQQHATEYPHMQPSVKQPEKSRENFPLPGNKNEGPRPVNHPPVNVPEPRIKEQPVIKQPHDVRPVSPVPKVKEQPRTPRDIRPAPQPQPKLNPKSKRKAE